jgi:hypothetical protein
VIDRYRIFEVELVEKLTLPIMDRLAEIRVNTPESRFASDLN